MPEPLLASAAPLFEVEGELRGELARDVVRLEIEEGTGGLRTLTMQLLAFGPVAGAVDQGLLYLDGSIVDFGKRLDVSIGVASRAGPVFSGFVSGLEAEFSEGAEPRVVVFAEDRLMKLRMTRRMRTYENVTDADIASAVASEHGFSADVDVEGPTYDVVQQWNVSDLAFLRERARLVQAELWLDGETLHFASRERRRATELTLVMGNELIEARLRADLAHQRTAVRVSGYDASAREVIDEEAEGDLVRSEASGGRTGPEVLERAFGARPTFRVREAPLAAGEARAWAKAEMLERARGFVTVVGTTSGSPEMTVGSRLKLERVGGPFDGGGYAVTSVRHTYDLEQGHRTHFQAERAIVEAA